MKLIIAGSRDLEVSISFINDCIYSFTNSFISPSPKEIISGCSTGIDNSGENYANLSNISIKKFYADWDTHGKAAGPIRNKEMAKYGEALLLIWDGESKGSANMKKEMLALNKPVYEVILRKHNV